MTSYKLKDITKIVNGATPSTKVENYWDGEISWITPKDMSKLTKRHISKGERNITSEGYDSCSTRILPIGSVVLTSRAPIGYVAITSKELCTNQGFKSFICEETILNNEYLYYWLIKNKDLLIGISGGSTFNELSTEQISNCTISLPSLLKQRHIVNTIGSLDNLIEKYKAIMQKLECFGNEYYSCNTKNSTTINVSNLNIKYGTSVVGLDRKPGNYPLYTSGGVNGYIDKYNLENGIIFGCRGTLGNVFFTLNKAFVLNTAFFLKAGNGGLGSLYFAIKQEKGFVKYSSGAAQPQITLENIKSCQLKILKDNFVLDKVLAKIDDYNKKIIKLENLKFILLKKYFE